MQLRALGRFDEAITEIKKAESLDPLSLIIGADVADVLFAARRYDEAIAQSRKTIDLEPEFPIAHFELGQALAQEKTYEEATEELQKANRISGGDATCTAVLAYAYAAWGKGDQARRLLDQLKAMPIGRFSYPADEALVHASLHEPDQAMVMLEKGEGRFDAQVLRSPAFDSLRSDPRFLAVLKRMGMDH